MAKIVVQVGRGSVGQKETRELAHLMIAPLYIFLSVELQTNIRVISVLL